MTISKQDNGLAITLKCGGCLDTAAAPEFAAALAEVNPAGQLTIDFTELDFIASSSLRALVAANKKLMAGGGKIAITGMNEVVADVFEVTGLTEVFEIR